jgi:hypothetical protein
LSVVVVHRVGVGGAGGGGISPATDRSNSVVSQFYELVLYVQDESVHACFIDSPPWHHPHHTLCSLPEAWLSRLSHCYVFPHSSCSACGLAFATANPTLDRVMLDCHVCFAHTCLGSRKWNLQTLSGGPGPRQVATQLTMAPRGKARTCAWSPSGAQTPKYRGRGPCCHTSASCLTSTTWELRGCCAFSLL